MPGVSSHAIDWHLLLGIMKKWKFGKKEKEKGGQKRKEGSYTSEEQSYLSELGLLPPTQITLDIILCLRESDCSSEV